MIKSTLLTLALGVATGFTYPMASYSTPKLTSRVRISISKSAERVSRLFFGYKCLTRYFLSVRIPFTFHIHHAHVVNTGCSCYQG